MINSSELLAILDRVAKTRVLVVGDVMLDRYWWGNASRLSPEAPVPVVALKKVSNLPGGAANVAANIAGLGAKAVLTGIVGLDEAAISLRESLLAANIPHEFLIESKSRPTTTKTRVLVHNQQIARVDDETATPLDHNEENALVEKIREVLAGVEAVVLSDYAKGCLTDSLIASVIADARKLGKMVIVDPKSRDLTRYSGATVLTPNLAEALNAAGIENGREEDADRAAEKILAETSVDSLLITLGEHGMKLFAANAQPIHFPSMARQVFDVTGAGDTVVAILGAALATGSNIQAAITLANIAAGLTVEKVGTTVVGIDELRFAIEGRISHVHEAG